MGMTFLTFDAETSLLEYYDKSNLFFRALLLGLACNQNLKEVFLDLSSCEVWDIYKYLL